MNSIGSENTLVALIPPHKIVNQDTILKSYLFSYLGKHYTVLKVFLTVHNRWK